MRKLILILIVFTACQRSNVKIDNYTQIPVIEDSCIFVEDMNHIVIDGMDYNNARKKRVHCVNVYNCSDVKISNLDVGAGGVTISNNKPQKDFEILFVEVKNAYNGILIYAEDSLKNISIRNSTIDSSRNNGIMVFSSLWPNRVMSNVNILSTLVMNTRGDKGVRPHTGSGMYISCTVKGLIENCIAKNNGWEYGHGNIGIWTFDSKFVEIENSSSHDNKSTTGVDGGGFDIDGGSEFCVIRNCSSFNNDGAGYLLYEYGSPNPCTNNTFIGNTSINDGKGNKAYSGFSLGGVKPVYNTAILNCTVKRLDNRPAITYFNQSNIIGLELNGNNF